jgi:hypothetical protein
MVVFQCPEVATVIRFPAGKQSGQSRNKKLKENTYLNEFDLRKQLVVYFKKIRRAATLYDLFKILTFSNPGLKVVSSNASPG